MIIRQVHAWSMKSPMKGGLREALGMGRAANGSCN